MKALIVIVIIVIVGFGASKLYNYYEVKANPDSEAKRQEADIAAVNPDTLPGMTYQILPSLQKARQEGPKAIKQWLDATRNNREFKDPARAWIELDYALLVKGTDPVESKRVFADVKARTPPDSPVFPRIKLMEKTFE